ncbi:MAG: hypothetical protein Q8R04_06635 [Nanoarchaeota archaeon]|nr:hypothetical protein [Nanoarchaeota archaeon]
MIKKTAVRFKNFAKEHFYIFVLLLLALFFFHNIISSTRIMNNIHYINDVTFYSYNMRESIKNKELPLWTPYFYSGRPLFAQPEYYFIDFNLLLILLTGNIYLAMNFSVIIHLFLAGLGMYLLISFLSNNRKAGFISALIYMFNGFVHTFVVPGNIMIMEGYSLVPFIFLFTVKALKSKNFVLNSAIAGLFTGFLIFTGGVIFIPYLFLLIAIYSLIYIIDSNISKRIIKLAVVGVLIFAVGFGVSAVKLLPGLEFMKLSNRGAGLPYQEYLGEPIQMKNFVFAFVTNVFSKGEHISSAIGIAGFALFLFGFYKFRHKLILFSAFIVLLSLLMSSESFLAKALYNVPIFNQTRHIERSIFLFAFGSSILAGFGFINLESSIERHKKIIKNTVFSVLVLLIFFELFLLQKGPQAVDVVKPNDIPILDYMGKDKSQFRTMSLALNDLRGATGYNYYSQLGISEMKGGSGIWFNDYIQYLVLSKYAPAKLWGLLNNKYVIASQNTSIDGLSYIAKFDACEDCTLHEAWGPYLYKNTMYLPRYYTVPNSILLVGDKILVKQLVYSLMLHNLNPKNTVLVEGTSINDYSPDFLNRFDYIFLVGIQVSESDIGKLSEYKYRGGIIIPDILSGKDTISDEEIDWILNKTKGNYSELESTDHSNNKIVLNLNGEKGWLVASERFAHFPGWKASINNREIGLFKADSIATAVYLEGEKGKLIFEYEPDSYKKGRLISLMALITISSYFVYFIFAKKFKAGGKNQA